MTKDRRVMYDEFNDKGAHSVEWFEIAKNFLKLAFVGNHCEAKCPCNRCWNRRMLSEYVSHPDFKAKTRCSSYVCPVSNCHTYGQIVSTEYQCLYYIVSYYKNLLQVPNGLNSGMDPILPQAVDQGFHTPRRNLHQRTPHLLSSRT
jgi:hypothetical protein